MNLGRLSASIRGKPERLEIGNEKTIFLKFCTLNELIKQKCLVLVESRVTDESPLKLNSLTPVPKNAGTNASTRDNRAK
ncbi:hypothetical protein BH10PLA2_BH10PLA2_36440 [soil metagenome]